MLSPQENRSVRETAALRPRLRGDLRFSIQEQGGRRGCVIEDPATTRFHRVGLEEYCFLRTLDGTRTVATVLAEQACAAGADAFHEEEALRIIAWARENQLLRLETPEVPERERHEQQTLRTAAAWLNPLSVRLPLGVPDHFFAALAAGLAPLLGWAGLLLWLGTLLAGAAHLLPEWGSFSRELGGLLDRENWLWMLLSWAGLKVLHELGHGVACRFFGAPVREVGVIFVLGLPMGYVDATASLGLASKWRRMAVAAAGLAVEFWGAAVAAIVWVRTVPGPWHTLAQNTVVTGTVVTLFFNANPLLKYDGYFLLADALEIPNLSTRGRAWAQRLLGWLLSGAPGWRPARPHGREEWLVALYGVAAWGWGCVVTAGLIMAASVVLRGGGLLFAILATLTWVALPVTRFLGALHQSARSGGARGGPLLLRGAAFAALAAGLFLVPWAHSLSGPGVIELPETEVLRAECAGFVAEVLVHDGQEVATGQVLLRLQNDEAEAERARTRLELASQKLKTRLAFTREDIATYQAEAAKTEAVRRSLAEQERYLATLTVRAPAPGRVTNRHLATLPGTWLRNGDELLRLGRARGSELKIAVTERQEPHFRAAVGAPLEVFLEGRGRRLPARLTRLDAHASRELAWPALTALAGGPVTLRRTSEAHEADRRPEYELAEPHFTATARIEEDAGLLPGETALIRLRSGRRETLWNDLRHSLSHWLASFSHRVG